MGKLIEFPKKKKHVIPPPPLFKMDYYDDSERVIRIRAALESINRLMAELKYQDKNNRLK